MSAHLIDPWRMAIENWLSRVEQGDPCDAFCDRWMRLSNLSTADLELEPLSAGSRGPWSLLGLRVSSFKKPVGHFTFAVKRHENRDLCLCISCPKFSSGMNEDLVTATLSSLFRLAPSGTVLEVILEDKIESPTSTLAVAGRYTDAGWGMNPANTVLISDHPRQWVFRFNKN